MLYQFYTVEIIKNQNGEYSHDVAWHWDEDATKAQLKGEAKYHEILSRAAVSEHAEHAAILFSSEGFPIANQCYKHAPIPEVNPVEETPTEE